MVNNEDFRKLALSFPDAIESPHFDKPSFRVRGKIFATLHPLNRRAVLKLSPIEQSVFCSFDKTVFFPVPGAWGAKVYTMVELSKVRKDMLNDALSVAYAEASRAKKVKSGAAGQ